MLMHRNFFNSKNLAIGQRLSNFGEKLIITHFI